MSLSGCSTLPSVEHTTATHNSDVCTTTLVAAQKTQDGVSPVFGAIGRTFSAIDASEKWLSVAANCSQRFSEGAIKAAAAYQEARVLAAETGLSAMLPTFGSTDLTGTAVPNVAVRAIALSQDKAAYSLEVIAARQDPTNATDKSLSLTHRDIAESVAQLARNCTTSGTSADSGDQCSSQDPRKKVYSVKNLLKNSSDYLDEATGLQTSLTAAIEMNCALEEFSAVEDADISDLTAKDRLTTAEFIARDVASAYEQGYPITPLPLAAETEDGTAQD